MTKNGQLFEDLHISDVSVISGIRPCGRSVDRSGYGRKNNGIFFVWSGEATFYSGDRRTVATDGELVFLPVNKSYRMEYTAQSTTFVLVNFDLCDAGGKDALLFEDITLLGKDNAGHRMARIMTDFELCSVAKTVEATLRKRELMYRLLGTLYASIPSPITKSTVDARIADGVCLLEQTYLESFPITRYAEASHVSVNTFRSIFQKQFGTSPLKYRNRLRIERARELLGDGDFTVAEVAYASGFENVGYFCKYYRQIIGETPGETKKKE